MKHSLLYFIASGLFFLATALNLLTDGINVKTAIGLTLGAGMVILGRNSRKAGN